MRILRIAPFISLAAVGVFSLCVFAQARAKQAAGKSVPDLSGNWESRFGRRPPEFELCGEPACRTLLGRAVPAPPEDIETPQMLPWAAEIYKVATTGIEHRDFFNASRQELNPAFSGCMPEGPAEVARLRGFEIRQFPDVVLLLFDYDHWVRRIYVDGRGHPSNRMNTWMGHSIGKYEGDTLVVDTVGISDKAWIDLQAHPHSDALRMTERFRRLDQKTLETQFTFDDPKAYVKPWTRRVTHELRTPGPQLWDSTECEELLRMGTHYSAESKK